MGEQFGNQLVFGGFGVDDGPPYCQDGAPSYSSIMAARDWT